MSWFKNLEKIIIIKTNIPSRTWQWLRCTFTYLHWKTLSHAHSLPEVGSKLSGRIVGCVLILNIWTWNLGVRHSYEYIGIHLIIQQVQLCRMFLSVEDCCHYLRRCWSRWWETATLGFWCLVCSFISFFMCLIHHKRIIVCFITIL